MGRLRWEEHLFNDRWHDLSVLLVASERHWEHILLHFLRSLVEKLHSFRLVRSGRASPLGWLFRLFVLFASGLLSSTLLILALFLGSRVQLTESDLDVRASLRVNLVWPRVELLHFRLTWDHR